MGPRDLNSLLLEGRLPKESNQSCYIKKKKKNVLPVGKTNLNKEAIRITILHTVSCLFVEDRPSFLCWSSLKMPGGGNEGQRKIYSNSAINSLHTHNPLVLFCFSFWFITMVLTFDRCKEIKSNFSLNFLISKN